MRTLWVCVYLVIDHSAKADKDNRNVPMGHIKIWFIYFPEPRGDVQINSLSNR